MPKRTSLSETNESAVAWMAVTSRLREFVQNAIASGHRIDTHNAAQFAEALQNAGTRLDPITLGTLFQALIKPSTRHQLGAHYTPRKAILEHVVRPLLLEPWRARLGQAETLPALIGVHEALTNMRILDPACGSGYFLHEAYCALQDLEREILQKAHERFSSGLGQERFVSTRQLFGIDIDPAAVQLAQISLAIDTLCDVHRGNESSSSPSLLFEHLDANIRCADALFCDWPPADLILGNPPFQSKNRMQQEFGPEYVQRLRQKYPEVPGRADYCVYWFRRAHDELAPGASAGLVGTNTIRQNYSREGGLDYIVQHGGTITEAVSSMVWPGDAIVHVSVVNWTKGPASGLKKLSWQVGDQLESPWQETRIAKIPASLSPHVDVTQAKSLHANANSGACFQGQTHGHEGFLLSAEEAQTMLQASEKNGEVIFPYLIGDDVLSNQHGVPSRWIIDFFPRQQLDARQYALPFQRIQSAVLPDREIAAKEEEERNAKLDGGGNQHHAHFLKRWWQLSYPRGELMQKLKALARYIVCSRVTKRPVFEFVSSSIHPSDALAVFPLEDDYAFGILQSSLHWAWFTARCSTLTARFRYTSETVFDSFPWPQSPTEKQCLAVAKAAVALRTLRRQMADDHAMNLRAMYASIEDPGAHPLKDAHALLDKAVRAAYGMPARQDPLTYLLELNAACASREEQGATIRGPGLPPEMHRERFVTPDAIVASACVPR